MATIELLYGGSQDRHHKPWQSHDLVTWGHLHGLDVTGAIKSQIARTWSHFTLSIHIYTCGAYDCRIWKEMFVWKWHSHPFEVRLIVKSSMMTRYTSESSKHLILALNPLASHPCTPCQTIWLIVSTHRKHIGQLGSSSQDGREIHIICIYIYLCNNI